MPGQNKTVKAGAETEVGIYKRNKKEKKKENTLSNKKAIKKTRKFLSFVDSILL